MQVERGFLKAHPEHSNCTLTADWDWHRLLKSLKRGEHMEKEIRRLVRREGFLIHAGCWDGTAKDFGRSNLPEVAALRRILRESAGDNWAGFQLYYAMNESEVRGSTGLDLVESMLAIFDEVTPAMNLCMQIEISASEDG